MRLCIYDNQTEKESTEFSVLIPTICWNKESCGQIGENNFKTMLDFPTVLCIITTKDSLEWTMSLFGFGIYYYTRIY